MRKKIVAVVCAIVVLAAIAVGCSKVRQIAFIPDPPTGFVTPMSIPDPPTGGK